jgi:hypothetical protein
MGGDTYLPQIFPFSLVLFIFFLYLYLLDSLRADRFVFSRALLFSIHAMHVRVLLPRHKWVVY